MSNPERAADFENIHAEYRDRIFSYLRRLTREPAVAEELSQETFLRVSGSLDEFRAESRLSTWIYRIATNIYLDHYRRSKTRRAGADPSLPELQASYAAEVAELSEPRLQDRLFEQSEMGDCVREFIDGLPPEHQTVIILHDLQGLKNAEIAKILDCSLDTIKIRIHRARQRLGTLLSQHCDFDYSRDNVLRCDRKQTSDPSTS